MSDVGGMVRELIAAGADPAVAAEIVTRAYQAGIEAQRPPDIHPTSTLEKRRAWDREYRRRKRDVHPNSTRIPPDPPDNADTLSLSKDSKNKKERERALATRIPPDWRPTSDEEAFAAQQGLPSVEISREAEKFRDYWHAKSGPQGRKLDWSATWRNWIRRVCEQKGFAPPSGPGPPREYRPPPGSGLPTDEELRAKYAERGEAEGTAGASADVLAQSMGVPRNKQNGLDPDQARVSGMRRMGEVLSPQRVDAVRDPDA